MGRIDLHNHLLFGLDDGAVDADESLDLGRLLVSAGFTDVVTTPHHRQDFAPTPEAVAARRLDVQALFDANDVPLRLHGGREHHLTPELLERLANGEAETLADGPYLLLELPFGSPVPALNQVLFQLRVRGVKPLIAHPERCAHFQNRPEAAREVVDAGGHLQLEIGSLSGLYGAPAARCAEAWLEAGLVSVVATDAHHPRSTREILGRGLETLERKLGTAMLSRLLEENPSRVLRGEPLLTQKGEVAA